MGLLYVIDGNDGSGKNTQAKLLRDRLTSPENPALLLSFPLYKENFFGRLLGGLLHKPGFEPIGENFADVSPYLASLPYALDRMDSSANIRSHLKMFGHVICDRYVSANQIHQGGKIADEAQRVAFLDWLRRLEYFELGNVEPDVSIYLDVPVEISLQLMATKEKDAVEQNRRYLENSAQAAKWLMTHESAKWIRIRCAQRDGVTMRTREDIHREIIEQLKERGNV